MFPPLPRECIEIVHRRVQVTLPVDPPHVPSFFDDNHADCDEAPSSAGAKDDTWCTEADVIQELVDCQGQAVVFTKMVGLSPRFVLARSQEQAEALRLRKLEQVDRVIVEVRIRGLRPNTVYFRTYPATGRSELAPTQIIALTPSAWAQDGLRVWARAQAQPSAATAQILRGDSVFCVGVAANANRLRAIVQRHYGVPSVSCNAELDPSIARAPFAVKCQLQLLAGRPVLVMLLLEQSEFEIDLEVQLALSRCSHVYLLVIVPWACATSTQELVRAATLKLGRVCRLLDVITDVPVTAATMHPLPEAARQTPAISPCPFFRFLPSDRSELGPPADDEMSQWISGKRNASLELIAAGRVPVLEYVRRLCDQILHQLAGASPRGPHEYALHKVLRGSGATTSLRVLAVELASSSMQPAVWVAISTTKSARVDPDWLGSVCPAVFLCDDTQYSLGGDILEQAALIGAAAIVVRVHTSAPAADVNATIVDPFLSPRDARLVCAVLKQHVAGAAPALDALLRRAADLSALRFDRHLFIFALTALRGEFRPAATLARDVLTEAADSRIQRAFDVVLALAYLGSFSTRHEAASLPFGQALEPCGVLLQRMPLLRSLLVVHGNNTVSLVHPMLARLLLLQCIRGCINQPMSLDQIESTHASVGEFLKQDHCYTDNLPNQRAKLLAVGDRADLFFTALVARFAYQPVTDSTVAEQLEGQLRRLLENEHWPVDQGYVELQLSRVVRQWGYYARQSHEDNSYDHELVQFLCQRSADLADAADEQLRTLDSLCNLAKALALVGQRRGSLVADDQNAIRANELMRRLDKSAIQHGDRGMQVKAVKMAMRHVPYESAWASAYKHWQGRAQDLQMTQQVHERSAWQRTVDDWKLGDQQFAFGGL